MTTRKKNGEEKRKRWERAKIVDKWIIVKKSTEELSEATSFRYRYCTISSHRSDHTTEYGTIFIITY
jgi:hypothetical protein